MKRTTKNSQLLGVFMLQYGRILMALCWSCNEKDIDQWHMNHIQELIAKRFRNLGSGDSEGRASTITQKLIGEFTDLPGSRVNEQLERSGQQMFRICKKKKRHPKLKELVDDFGEFIASDGVVNKSERQYLIILAVKIWGFEEETVNNTIDVAKNKPRRQSSGTSAYSDWGAPDTPSPTSSPPSSGAKLVDEDLTLESLSSGSGLLDLSRESGDTDLGAELLHEVYSNEPHLEDADGSGIFEDADGSPPSIYESD